MPAVSEKQRKFMAAERGRERAGKKTKTHMNDSQLTDYMRKDGERALKEYEKGHHHGMKRKGKH